MTRDDILDLLNGWIIAMKGENRSPRTVQTYRDGINGFVAWCDETGRAPELTRETVTAWIAALLEGGAESATARVRQVGIRQLSRWAAEEGYIKRDELAAMRSVRLDVKVVDSLTDEQVTALIRACRGKRLTNHRDEAIVRFMVETGARADEVIAMRVSDVALTDGAAVVRRGKGGKGRTLPFGPKTAAAIDKYNRLHRRQHPLVGTGALWLGERGQGFTYSALWRTLKARATAAGIEAFHPHQLRHTAAARWLDAGGSEGGLMAIAGWSRREMLDRYVRSTSERRAADEARRLNLGDL